MSDKDSPQAQTADKKYLRLSLALNILLLICVVVLPLYYANKITELSQNIEQVKTELIKKSVVEKVPPPIPDRQRTQATLYGKYVPSERGIEGELNFTQKNSAYYVEINTASPSSGHSCEFSAACKYDKEYERFECSNDGTIYLSFGRKNSLEVSEFDNPASGSWCGTRMSLAGFYIK